MSEFPGAGCLLGLFLFGFLGNRMFNKEDGVATTTKPQPLPDELTPPRFHLPMTMSHNAGLNAWWIRRFNHRPAYDYECLFDLDEDGTLVITLPMPRRVTRLEVQFENEGQVPLKNVVIETPEDVSQPEWTGEWVSRSGNPCLQLDFDGVKPLTFIRVTHDGSGLPGHCTVWVNRKGHPDAEHLEGAMRAEALGDAKGFAASLEAYQELCPTNPVVALRLAYVFRNMHEPGKAEVQAIRAIAGNRGEPGANFCRELAEAREWGLSDERLKELRDELADWDLDGHHGLVTLNNERHYLTGPGDFVRERHVSAMLVRRQAAARKFRSVGIPMVSGWGGLLHTAARVRRVDGTTDAINDDRFTVGSAEDDNPFIAVARRSIGNWILPDLEPGDVVEFTCDKVKLGQARPFTLANLADPHCPTLHGRVTFTAPPDREIEHAVRNSAPGYETGLDGGTSWKQTTLVRERMVPRRSHSDPYQLLALNPVVAFSLKADGWDDMGGKLLKDYYEAVDATGKIPERLAAAYADVAGTGAKLARAFYWIRDHIKYASVASHHEVLLSPERAEYVLESGMGDCKDVSYLLALVCRDLDVPWEFVLMSTENGIIIEELPADQFDHVILRAKIDGEWRYLDASSNEATFGAPPPMAQDLHALAGREPFALVTLPVVPADFNRITIRQTLAGVDDGWLLGGIDVRLEGYAARYLDELWKHNSLTAVDPDRAADDTVRALLTQFHLDSVERLQDTGDSDALHFTAEGRHARLVELDGKKIASFGFTAPGLVTEEDGKRRFRERYLFPFRLKVSYELAVADELRAELRAVSYVEDLDLPMCTLREERGGPEDEVTLKREIVLGRREVAGDDLAELSELFNRLGAASRVVVALGTPSGRSS